MNSFQLQTANRSKPLVCYTVKPFEVESSVEEMCFRITRGTTKSLCF